MYFLQGIAGQPVAVPPMVKRGILPTGDRGTATTLAKMRALVDAGAKTLAVREVALRLVRALPAHDTMAELDALFRFVRDHVRFTGDVLGVETLQAADYTLKVGAGDCDDRAVLLASLARSISIPVELKFRVIAANPARPNTFSHVYLVAKVRGHGDVPLDPTYNTNTLGWEYPNSLRTAEVRA